MSQVPSPQVQIVPDFQDIVTLVCTVVNGQPSYMIQPKRVRYKTESGIALAQPEVQELHEGQVFVHLSECLKSIGIGAISTRDALTQAAAQQMVTPGRAN